MNEPTAGDPSTAWPDGRNDNRSDTRSEFQSDSQSDVRVDTRADSLAGSSADRPVGRRDDQEPETPADARLITVSNRLPVVLERDDNGTWDVRTGSGGLVTALAPVLRNRGGTWIGWPGAVADGDGVDIEELLDRAAQESGYQLRSVMLSAEERLKFYQGFANEIIWPLFHDLQTLCDFNPSYWYTYQTVNRRFAHAVTEASRPGDFIWIHDYHLMSVAKELRALGVKARCGFFLHIPFPPLDLFMKLPWRFQLLRDLLEFDLLGFQTMRDRRNFVHCVRTLVKDVRVKAQGSYATIRTQNREVRVGSFPISIDAREFARQAASQEVAETAWYIHEDLPQRKIILGVDRLDYTKGIPHRLDAFRSALRRFPDLHEKVTLIQVVVPSRFNIPRYMKLKTEIERLVGEINGEFTRSGWVPIHYIYRSLDRRELLAYYRTAEVALVTPIKDGMNLVAKEYCASNLEGNGVLILSEFAGAVAQMQRGALLVNPYDLEGVGAAIYQAIQMPEDERRRRMGRLRAGIRRQDVYWWVDAFLQAAFAKRLDQLPVQEEYFPTPKLAPLPFAPERRIPTGGTYVG